LEPSKFTSLDTSALPLASPEVSSGSKSQAKQEVGEGIEQLTVLSLAQRAAFHDLGTGMHMVSTRKLEELLGMELGCKLGTLLGMELGCKLGTLLGMELGCWLGILLGMELGNLLAGSPGGKPLKWRWRRGIRARAPGK